MTRETIWRWVTPRWRRHLTKVLERERDVDAVVVFTVPMAHFRGIPTYLRERFGVPVVFYDGDVPMSLPEFGGMDTGFNYYHGADPSEYDLVVSNSEGGLERLRELGARRAEAVFWGADTEFFAPRHVEKVHDVFFYGYGDKFRRDWMAAMVGEPSRAAPELEFALGGRDFQGDTGRAWLIGDVPFNAFAQAISQARINLNITRRSHASVFASSSARPFELAAAGATIVSNPYEGIERWFEPGEELVVVNDADEASAHVPRAARRSRRRPRRWGPARASASSTSTPTRTGRSSCSRSSAWMLRCRRVRKLAIVPARNEEGAVAGVVSELRAFDPELDVVVIDDGSTDATAERAAAAGAAVVRLPFNLGIGGAVQTGFKYALEHGYEVVVRLDGDGQHDPQELPSLLAPARARRGRRRRRLALRGRERRLQAAVRAAGRDPLVRAARLAADSAEADRHDLRLPGGERARDPPLRRRLPARLPRGRGRGDGRPPPPAHPRGAGSDARPRDRRVVDHFLRSLYYAIKVTLALLVGIFRRRVVPIEEA